MPATSPLHPKVRYGLCTFSCHRHWEAIRKRQPGTKFSDALSFLDYAQGIGAQGVQTHIADEPTAQKMRDRCESLGAYYEADIRFPKTERDLSAFEADVRHARLAGAAVARTVMLSGRRYETFKNVREFGEHQQQSETMLHQVEPLLKKHGLKLAIENHKDNLAAEFVPLLKRVSSEWIGVCVDTGNNLALLEEPYAVIEAIAPYALSVHLKDMAVQPADDGFLLSEVPFGTGFLDLKRIIATLLAANSSLIFNIEMGTRDPLHVPCLTARYWETFANRPAVELAHSLSLVKQHPPSQNPPTITGKDMLAQMADEEANNQRCLAWMKELTDG